MTDFNKLADALESNSRFVRHGVSSHGDAELMLQAARILRAAGAADVAALMELASTLEYTAYDDGSNGKGDTPECDAARAALESALRVAMAQRAGFVMVPVEPSPEMLNELFRGYTTREQAYRAMIAASQAGAAQEPKP